MFDTSYFSVANKTTDLYKIFFAIHAIFAAVVFALLGRFALEVFTYFLYYFMIFL